MRTDSDSCDPAHLGPDTGCESFLLREALPGNHRLPTVDR